MKKQLFWMIGAALALTSCSNDEQVAVNPGNEITFRTAVTRATEMTQTDLKDFNVTAYLRVGETYHEHILKETFTGSSGEGYAGKDDKHYWLTDATAIRGQAWSPVEKETVTFTEKDENTYKYEFLVSKYIGDQKDFIIGNINSDRPDKNGAINIDFKHQLAQIEIKVDNSVVESMMNIEVKGVKLGGVHTGTTDKKPSITFTYSEKWNDPAWDDVNTPTHYDSIFSEPIKSFKNVIGEPLMVYPQTISPYVSGKFSDENGAYIALLAKLEHTDTNETIFPMDKSQADETYDTYGWIYVAIPNVEWQKGKKYTYTLKFEEGKLGYELDGSSILWENDGSATPLTFTVTNGFDMEVETTTDPTMGAGD